MSCSSTRSVLLPPAKCMAVSVAGHGGRLPSLGPGLTCQQALLPEPATPVTHPEKASQHGAHGSQEGQHHSHEVQVFIDDLCGETMARLGPAPRAPLNLVLRIHGHSPDTCSATVPRLLPISCSETVTT